MAFQFRLQSVLKIRQHLRDHERQSIVIARVNLAEVTKKRDLIAIARNHVISELRSLNDAAFLDVEKATQYQRHARELASTLIQAEATVTDAVLHFNASLKRLSIADQSARGLERLSEKQLTEFQERQSKSDAREFEEVINTDRRGRISNL